LEAIKILKIELYVMVLIIMDTMLILVKKHVHNINILHYKMVTDKLVGVVVIMK